jgi:hypothetical protein
LLEEKCHRRGWARVRINWWWFVFFILQLEGCLEFVWIHFGLVCWTSWDRWREEGCCGRCFSKVMGWYTCWPWSGGMSGRRCFCGLRVLDWLRICLTMKFKYEKSN